jgi:hypothetical protein
MITAHGTFEMARRTLYDSPNRFNLVFVELYLLFSFFVGKSVSDIENFIHEASPA